MNIWKATGVDQTPEIELRNWQVFAVPHRKGEPTHHFVGYNMTEGEGRVSSAIVEFDPELKLGKTASGRVYALRDFPGLEGDGAYVFDCWLSIHQVDKSQVVDVTNKYISEIAK